MSWLEVVLRLAVALACGAAIGIERQYRQHSAGLRTSALVATGSALFVLVAALTPNGSHPTGVAAQVVSGVGFLCAGVIIRDGLNIRGLNTAVTLWCASGVGVLAGAGDYLVAAPGAVMVLLANLLLRPLARFLDRHAKTTGEAGEPRPLRPARGLFEPAGEPHPLPALAGVSRSDLTLLALQSADTQDSARVEVRADLQADGRKDALLEQVVARLSLEEGVSAVRWEVASPDSDDEAASTPGLAPRPNSPEAEASI